MVTLVGNDNVFLPNVVGKMRFPFNSWSVIDGWMILTFTSMTFLLVKPIGIYWIRVSGNFLRFTMGLITKLGKYD